MICRTNQSAASSPSLVDEPPDSRDAAAGRRPTNAPLFKSSRSRSVACFITLSSVTAGGRPSISATTWLRAARVTSYTSPTGAQPCDATQSGLGDDQAVSIKYCGPLQLFMCELLSLVTMR